MPDVSTLFSQYLVQSETHVMSLKYNNILVLAIQQHSYHKDSLQNEKKKLKKKKEISIDRPYKFWSR